MSVLKKVTNEENRTSSSNLLLIRNHKLPP